MRHIEFDDSTVLSEFARIAQEKGLIKVAQEPTETVTFSEDEVEPIIGGAKSYKTELLKSLQPLLQGSQMLGFFGGPKPKVTARAQILFGAISQIPDTTPITQAANAAGVMLKEMAQEDADYREFTNNAFDIWKGTSEKHGAALQLGQAAADGAGANPLVSEMQKLNSLYAKHMQGGDAAAAGRAFNQALAQTMTKLRGQYGNHPELVKFEAQAKNIAAPTTAAKNEDMTKSAKGGSDLYDVTDETGEQLVEKAHPGGGTKTELTHSKTDENLVETIVEQQKKDLEVAKSVPKGTYATLVNLYAQLHKMGQTDSLKELKDIIVSIATPEDVIEYTLVSLADRLDSAGYRCASDRVDSLLKKKVTAAGNFAEEAKAAKKDFLDRLSRVVPRNNAVGKYKDQAVLEAQRLDTSSVRSVLDGISALAARWGRALPEMNDIQSLNEMLYAGVATDEETYNFRAQYGIAGNTRPGIDDVPALTPIPRSDISDLPLEPIPARATLSPAQKRRLQWRKYYNAALSKIPSEVKERQGLTPISGTDAKAGGKGYRAALRKVRSTGVKTLKEFVTYMMTKTPIEPAKPARGGGKGPAAPAAPGLTNQQRNTAYRAAISAVEKAHGLSSNEIGGLGDEWRKVRNVLYRLSASGKYTTEQIASLFTKEKLEGLRTPGLQQPAMPQTQVR